MNPRSINHRRRLYTCKTQARVKKWFDLETYERMRIYGPLYSHAREILDPSLPQGRIYFDADAVNADPKDISQKN